LLLLSLGCRAEVPALVEQCRQLQHNTPRQAIEVCEQAFAAVRDQPEVAEDMLLRRSDAQLVGGDFEAAAATLDRVAALPQGEWKRQFRLERRRGILEYRRDHYADALSRFRNAEQLAEQHADNVGLGQARNDIGNALRRIGDFREALQAFLDSLDLKRRGGDAQLGPVLNNIGDLYRDLGERDNAAKYYTQALAEHERAGRGLDAAHTLEAMGALQLDGGDNAAAERTLQQSFDAFVKAEALPDQLRVATQLARAELALAALPRAQEWVEHAQELVRQLGVAPPPELSLQQARLLRAQHATALARVTLRNALTGLATDSNERIALLQELADVQAEAGDTAAAFATLREFHQADLRRRDAEHDQHLAQLRVRFDVAEKDREIHLLEAQNRLRALEVRQRTTQLQLAVATALLAIGAVVWWFWRRQQRARVVEAAHSARLAEEIAQYRRAARELGLDRQRLQAALDLSSEAVLVLEGGDRVVASNAAAGQLLGLDAAGLQGLPIAERIDGLHTALAVLDDTGAEQELSLPWARGRLSSLDEGLALLRLRPPQLAAAQDHAIEQLQRDPLRVERYAASLAAATERDAATTAAIERVDADLAQLDASVAPADSAENADFRRALVDLMLLAVAAWERSTSSNRIELAEKSRVWRITIDEGRLRVRAMERYLSLAKLPRQPRWREVLRTAYFVLAECPLDETERAALKQHVEALQAAVRRRAML
jgi:PAS domain-containing protein